MIDDEDIENFLEHHGVRGMRWGVRKPKSGVETSKQKSARRKRIVGVASLGMVAVGGAIIAGHILQKNHAMKLRDINKFNNELAIPFLAKYGNTPKTVWHTPGPFLKPEPRPFLKSQIGPFQISKHESFVRKIPSDPIGPFRSLGRLD